MIILCTHNDGGVGKTTLAIHATGVLISKFSRTLLVDCDDQADAWQFYADRIPEKLGEVLTKDNLSVMYNKDRKSLKQLVRPEQYDNFVLDINTPLENTVQVIVQDDPDIILVPVNQSQRSKALRNLPRTLKMISQLEFKVGADPEVIIVPMGIEENRVNHVLESAENKPTRCRIAPGMPNALPSLRGETLIFRWLKRRKIVNFSKTDERALTYRNRCKSLFTRIGNIFGLTKVMRICIHTSAHF